MLGREHGERRYQQAFRQASADAMDQARRAPAAANRMRTLDGTLRQLSGRWYPGLANDNGNEAGSNRRGVTTPHFLMLSHMQASGCYRACKGAVAGAARPFM